MSTTVFDYEKQVALLNRFKSEFLCNDFIYKIGAEIIMDCAIRFSSDSIENLLLYGYFGENTKNFTKIAKNITYAFIVDLETEYNQLSSVKANEENLPFPDGSFDCAFSNLSLHFINDIPLALQNYHKILRNGGMLTVTFIGENSLHELREAFYLADAELYNGTFLRVMPMLSSQTIFELVNRCGFYNSVAHIETISVTYHNLASLLRDLRNMGFGDFLAAKKCSITSNFLEVAENTYLKHQGAQGNLKLTFDIVTVSAFTKK